MRILYVVHQFYPDSSAGTERFLLSLANAVQRSGHYAEVVTYSMKDSSELRQQGRFCFAITCTNTFRLLRSGILDFV